MGIGGERGAEQESPGLFFFFNILEINDLKTGQQFKAWFGHQRQEMSHSGSHVFYRQGGGNAWSRKI